jgi:hypothetical protein
MISSILLIAAIVGFILTFILFIKNQKKLKLLEFQFAKNQKEINLDISKRNMSISHLVFFYQYYFKEYEKVIPEKEKDYLFVAASDTIMDYINKHNNVSVSDLLLAIKIFIRFEDFDNAELGYILLPKNTIIPWEIIERIPIDIRERYENNLRKYLRLKKD